MYIWHCLNQYPYVQALQVLTVFEWKDYSELESYFKLYSLGSFFASQWSTSIAAN